jgi:hypothetical protein
VIPGLAVVRVGGDNRTLRLWLPLFLLWPLMLPLALAGPVVARAHIAWQFVSALRGTYIEVDSPGFTFRIRFI